MGGYAEAWSADGRGRLFGAVPQVAEMQSEGVAAGAARAVATHALSIFGDHCEVRAADEGHG
jgi:pyruvate-ferredoxin/flavodoxin oxidoreductase